VNLFSASADPLRQELPGQPLFLRAAGVDPLHMEVYSVEHVEGLRTGGDRIVHPSFGAFAHLGSEPSAPFYVQSRSRSPLDGFSDTTLTLGTPAGEAPPLLEETLSVDMTCTNRGLPSRIGLGDIHVPTQNSPTLAQFRNITPPTHPVPAPLGEELHWQLLAHLALNQRSLTELPTLKGLLGLYNFQSRADQNASRANALRAESLQEVECEPARRFLEGTPVRGMRTRVSVDEAKVAGPGDAFLLGCVLDDLLASAVTLNAFSELWVRLTPSQSEYRWTARNGERRLA
jgi:type VI secretion system protein ImpG